VDVLKKFHLLEKIPDAVLSYIKDGLDDNKMETPKPGNSVFSKNHASIIASLEQAMSAAKMRAAALGYEAEFYSPLLNGEARDCGVQLGEFLRKQSEASQPGGKPRCWIGGGETTVTIKGNGYGGRNQELALAAVDVLKGIPGATLISFATDGDDGQSPAAGAVVTDNTYQDAIAQGINPAEYLTNNDSYSFFSRMNLSITTGSTGTNVNDMVLLILD
jgi:glycerate-2-kinase